MLRFRSVVAGTISAYSIKPQAARTVRCEYFNETACSDPTGKSCQLVEECQTPEADKRNHCYALWMNNSAGVPSIKLKGCFIDNKDCYDQQRCVEKREEPKKEHLFCCCEGDMCNQNFTWDPVPTPPPTVASKVF